MTFETTIPAAVLLTWESQVRQYRAFGEPGITYFAGETAVGVVDCLLYRNEKGLVVGICNHYGFDSEWEQKGNVNVWVRPDCQGQGIGTALIREAASRWPIDLDQQRFTAAGAAFAETLRANGIL